MAFIQKIRIPAYLTQPSFPLDAVSFRLANGDVKNMSSVVRKVYKLKTDWMPERWHENLRIALAHDFVQIESSKFIGGIAMEGTAYEIEWNDYLDYPTAKAEAQVQVDNFDFSNSSCVSCELAGQLDLTDDNFGTAVEGGSGSGNVFSNDSIFCDPVTASIVTYNSTYLSGAPTIDNTGAVTFNLNTPLPDITSAKIFTYRVTCPDGSYDDADVYINIDGSLAGCSPPDNLRDAVPVTYSTADITWDQNGSPADGWYWEVYEADNLGAIILTNTTPLGFPRAQMTGLNPCTTYKLFVRSVCEAGVNESAYSTYDFTTDCHSETCGQYEIGFDNGEPDMFQILVTYLNCAGGYANVFITNTQTRIVCMQESSPGSPRDVFGPFTSITYLGNC